MGARHWTAWGDPRHDRELAPAFARALAADLGPGNVQRDRSLADLVASVPASRLPDHPVVRTGPDERVRHARGRGFADLVDLRGGLVSHFPDGVAYPETGDAVREVLDWARGVGAQIIPFGGGTSVVGHLTPLAGDRPILSVDLRHLARLHDLDTIGGLATFGSGIAGPDLEAQLRARGFTLGHTPQSFEYSTLGGWIVTRSSGQFSLGYGRIERLFAGEAERVRAFSHVSHPYQDGANLYTTFLFRLARDPAETRRRWAALKEAASRAIVAHGATISHQHGVGLDHLPHLSAEKGELGLAALRAACAAFDPDGMMNPGKLFA